MSFIIYHLTQRGRGEGVTMHKSYTVFLYIYRSMNSSVGRVTEKPGTILRQV